MLDASSRREKQLSRERVVASKQRRGDDRDDLAAAMGRSKAICPFG